MVDLFGDSTRKMANFHVFHDESEPVPDKGWLLIGLLFVDEQKVLEIEEKLCHLRKLEGYEKGEIHFCDLPKSFEGQFGAKARVAKRWMEAYQHALHEDAMFSCLAVDRSSPSFNRKRFKEEYHIYNRFTAMAIKAGISYLLAPLQYDDVTLTVVSDGKHRKSRPEKGIVDNFESYLPFRVELDNFLARLEGEGARPYPKVSMKPIQTMTSASSNLLQLTDLLLGATQAALVGASKRPVKRELGRMIVRWYQDLQKPPWQQQYKMHRKFNLWGFPDENGKAFNKFSMALSTCDEQLPRL